MATIYVCTENVMHNQDRRSSRVQERVVAQVEVVEHGSRWRDYVITLRSATSRSPGRRKRTLTSHTF